MPHSSPPESSDNSNDFPPDATDKQKAFLTGARAALKMYKAFDAKQDRELQMHNMETALTNAWESHRKTALPADAPEPHISECYYAFFAGTVTVTDSILAPAAPDQSNLTTIRRRVEQLERELDTFTRRSQPPPELSS